MRCSLRRQRKPVGSTRIAALPAWLPAACRLRAAGLLASVFALLAVLAGNAAASTVRDVTLLPHDDGVRVVIDLGSKVPFQHLTYDHPPRLVIELPDVSWQLPERRGQRAYRMVKGFQFGRLSGRNSSLIIDVDQPFEIETVFELPPSDSSGFRIVTDLAPCPPTPPCAVSGCARTASRRWRRRSRRPIAPRDGRQRRALGRGTAPARSEGDRSAQVAIPEMQMRRKAVAGGRASPCRFRPRSPTIAAAAEADDRHRPRPWRHRPRSERARRHL